jgi:Transposase DDE domain
MEYISDVLRTLNAQEGWALRYKPFWNRLADQSFPKLMRTLFRQLCSDLAVQVLEGEIDNVAHQFSHIFIDDGSSFAIARGLQHVFPGRFTTKTPAAVELHAHMDLLSGNVLSVALAPDTETERKFLPAATSLPKGSLSLRDRGYIDVGYFAELSAHGAYLICRSPCSINPTIVKVLSGLPRRVAKRFEGKSLKQVRLSSHSQDLDLLVAFERKRKTVQLRLIIPQVVPKRALRSKQKRVPFKKKMRNARKSSRQTTWFLTNVKPSISVSAVAALYRLRWQVELLFKDWKSNASLHALQSQDRHIVEGFIWASLCAAFVKRSLAHWTQRLCRRPISTRLASMAGPQILALCIEWLVSGLARARLERLLAFICANAIPTHPERRARAPAAKIGLVPALRPLRLNSFSLTAQESRRLQTLAA